MKEDDIEKYIVQISISRKEFEQAKRDVLKKIDAAVRTSLNEYLFEEAFQNHRLQEWAFRTIVVELFGSDIFKKATIDVRNIPWISINETTFVAPARTDPDITFRFLFDDEQDAVLFKLEHMEE